MDSEVESESGAEQAFEDLKAEVAALRRSVEALPTAKSSQPKDYSPTLGVIAQQLETLSDTLQAIEKHPAIRRRRRSTISFWPAPARHSSDVLRRSSITPPTQRKSSGASSSRRSAL